MLVKTDPPFLQEAPPKRGDSPLTLFHQLGGCPTGRRTAPLVGSRLKTFEVPDIPLPADGLGLGPEHTWSVTRRDTMCGRLFVQGRLGRFFGWIYLSISSLTSLLRSQGIPVCRTCAKPSFSGHPFSPRMETAPGDELLRECGSLDETQCLRWWMTAEDRRFFGAKQNFRRLFCYARWQGGVFYM